MVLKGLPGLSPLPGQVVIVFYFVLLQTTMAAAQNEVRDVRLLPQ